MACRPTPTCRLARRTEKIDDLGMADYVKAVFENDVSTLLDHERPLHEAVKVGPADTGRIESSISPHRLLREHP